jgi:tetratricopeptide (TPR) repeat protein
VRSLLMLSLLGLLACGPGRSLDRAERALQEGDFAGAEAGFRQVLERWPDQADALYGLGFVYNASGDVSRARDYFNRCVRVAPQDARGHRGLGLVAIAEGNPLQAEEHLTEALRLSPDDPRALSTMGMLRLSEGRHEEALALLTRAQAAEPDRAEYALNIAEAQLRLKRHEEALATVDAALQAELREPRFRGMLLVLHARIIVAMTSDRIDPARCDETAPPVLTWLSRATGDLEEAISLGIPLGDLPAARRLVARRKSVIAEQCPGAASPR